MKCVMNGGYTFVTKVRKYRVNAMLLFLGYNILTLITSVGNYSRSASPSDFVIMT